MRRDDSMILNGQAWSIGVTYIQASPRRLLLGMAEGPVSRSPFNAAVKSADMWFRDGVALSWEVALKFNWPSLIVGTLMALQGTGAARAADNMLGVYADSTGTSACTAATGLVKCYVVLSNVSDNVGVSGWQFALRVDGDGEIFSPIMPGQTINIEQFPRMMLGRAMPIPAQAKMVLMSFSAYIDGPASIYVDSLSESLPAAILLATTGQLRQVGYEYGGYDLPVFALGGAACPERNTDLGVVATTSASWGNVKALYR